MTKKEPKIEVKAVCEACKGTGRVMATPIASVTCEACEGTGVKK